MRAIIMAGGFGTRLRPLTINLPKPMVPVGNLPMMEHVVKLLKKHDITEITALLYFQADAIREYFGDGSAFGVQMDYCQPDEDFGTAGAVKFALTESDDTTLVISGDLVTDFDLTEAIAWHKEKKADATILLTRVENPLAYGIVITDDNGQIERFLEKPSWGEAFSDTINTGIYLLEPSATALISKGQNFDFSQNLYPLMLSKNMGLFGTIMSGYWKDIGNVEEYRLAHLDYYAGNVKLELDGTESEHKGVPFQKGSNVRLDESVTLEGKVVLGNDVTIGRDTLLRNCTIGNRSAVGDNCKIKETTIWSDVRIGRRAMLNSSIVCNRSLLDDRVQLLDKAIISDNCSIGAGASVRANCKLWPDKTVDEGAIVSSSMVWGEKWNRELFTDSKVTGLALTEITPEMCVRLGAAFGASLGKGASVVTSRDASDTTRLLRRSFISGVLAAGVNVSDLEAMPVPLVRYALSKGEFAAGMYMRHSPADYRLLDIIVFDGSGLDMQTAKLKKIERNYFGEDFERASLDSIGHLTRLQRVADDYRLDFMNNIDADLIRSAGFKLVIDHANGASSQIFPSLFSLLGVNATELNASLNPRKFSVSRPEQARSIVQLSAILTSLNADIGLALNPVAEKLTVIDEYGKPIDPNILLLIVTDLFLQTHKAKTIAVPVAASMGVEEIASRYGVEVIRVASSHRDMMEIIRSGKADFVGGTKGGFIFPHFQTGSDAIMATAKILEMMARTNLRLGQLRSEYEHYVRETASVPCPWSKKGLVMRKLITESASKERQLVDGVRIFEDDGWVLIVPDRFGASFNIIAESTSKDATANLVTHYREFVESCQQD